MNIRALQNGALILCVALGLAACGNADNAKEANATTANATNSAVAGAKPGTWIDYKSADGSALKVKFFEKSEAGIPDKQFFASVRVDDGESIMLEKVAEENGSPVYSSDTTPSYSLLVKEDAVGLSYDGNMKMYKK